METTRLSIDITAEEKQKIKAMAAINGMSIKDYVLNQTIEATESWNDLKKALKPRLIEAEKENYSQLSFDDIIKKAKKQKKS